MFCKRQQKLIRTGGRYVHQRVSTRGPGRRDTRRYSLHLRPLVWPGLQRSGRADRRGGRLLPDSRSVLRPAWLLRLPVQPGPAALHRTVSEYSDTQRPGGLGGLERFQGLAVSPLNEICAREVFDRQTQNGMNRGGGCAVAIASWTAAVLCRFCAHGRDRKAPEDWRSPKPGVIGSAHGNNDVKMFPTS